MAFGAAKSHSANFGQSCDLDHNFGKFLRLFWDIFVPDVVLLLECRFDTDD
jgi:hypothetical protein